MLKFTIILLAIVFVLVIGMLIWLKRFQNDPDVALRYAKKRKGEKDVSLIIRRNSQELISINPNVALPLASTVKVILVIEYARQVSNKMIDENTLVPKEELLKYYIDQTDGRAHKKWVEENDKNHYTLKEIAIGMAAYSSNANTEFLLNYIGIAEVNNILESLKLKNHSYIFPIVSSLHIPGYIRMKEKITDKKDLLNRMKTMSMDEYIKYAQIIHDHLTNKENRDYMEDVKVDYEFQKIWSDRLPSGSASDYLSIMKMINGREAFNSTMQSCIEEILSYSLYINEENRKWIQRGGMKGGSTLFVYTYASYTTDKIGNQTEIVFLSNNLSALTSKKIKMNFNQFALKILTNESFRKQIS
ncbi:D-alanyl-D-alanine carboxypeptidase [Salibacterium salarium]|uniref:D-alanyl-D-alanine carboxypeptidase n=1 Tax=Salibacterium salarium TaxID=284579 RepID=A0A428MUV3_9BACI|nr:serine hydrolase [Salibacterium salarium]RSL29925.1 D-alanyl-D-alanine carboxypeptidase [Salibacterium salarium]